MTTLVDLGIRKLVTCKSSDELLKKLTDAKEDEIYTIQGSRHANGFDGKFAVDKRLFVPVHEGDELQVDVYCVKEDRRIFPGGHGIVIAKKFTRLWSHILRGQFGAALIAGTEAEAGQSRKIFPRIQPDYELHIHDHRHGNDPYKGTAYFKACPECYVPPPVEEAEQVDACLAKLRATKRELLAWPRLTKTLEEKFRRAVERGEIYKAISAVKDWDKGNKLTQALRKSVVEAIDVYFASKV